MIARINEAGTLTEHTLCKCKWKFDSKTCNWNHTCRIGKYQRECKKYRTIKKKDSTCICKNRSYLESVGDDLVDEFISAMNSVSTNVKNTLPTNVTNTTSAISNINVNVNAISILPCKKTIKTWDVDVDNMVNLWINWNRNDPKYLFRYLDEVISPLVLILPKMCGYDRIAKDKDEDKEKNKNNILMSFRINSDKLLEKSKTEDLHSIELNS